METVSFIGAGMMGKVLARLALAAGYEVVLSNSRGPETLAELIAELGEGAHAATADEAARSGDFVVAAVPLKDYGRLPADTLAGKIVVDALNYYPERDGVIEGLHGGSTPTSMLVQQHLNASLVIKTFNTIDFLRLGSLARPAGASDRSALPVAGNDATAKDAVMHLVDRVGYDPIDAGALSDSGRLQNGAPAYVQPYLPALPQDGRTLEEYQQWLFTVPDGVPVSADRLRELIG